MMEQRHISRMERKTDGKPQGQEDLEEAHENAQEVADRLEEQSRHQVLPDSDTEINSTTNTPKEGRRDD